MSYDAFVMYDASDELLNTCLFCITELIPACVWNLITEYNLKQQGHGSSKLLTLNNLPDCLVINS